MHIPRWKGRERENAVNIAGFPGCYLFYIVFICLKIISEDDGKLWANILYTMLLAPFLYLLGSPSEGPQPYQTFISYTLMPAYKFHFERSHEHKQSNETAAVNIVDVYSLLMPHGSPLLGRKDWSPPSCYEKK